MLTLLTFPASFGQPSHSPFCVKAMGLLNLAGVAWQPDYLNDPRKMPYSKLPVLNTPDGLVPDSANIQAYLEAHGANFHVGLGAKETAQAEAFMGFAETNLHLTLIHERWLNDANWPVVRDIFFKDIPKPIRHLVTRGIRKTVATGLQGQGFARFSEKDRLDRLERDLGTLCTQLGDQAFLFGDRPCAADTIVAPLIGMIHDLPADCPARRIMRERTSLAAYMDRCKAAFYTPRMEPLSAAA